MDKFSDRKEIISRLKFISKIKPYQKIDVNNLTLQSNK